MSLSLLNEAWQGKAILLVDLDAFFASVEQLDHPAWRGKPVIVGGSSERRGVVSTASYEARRYGVHSAMPASTAARLCPDAIWTEGHFGRYREVSDEVMRILRDETPFVQQVSIDEAFLDVTPSELNTEHPLGIAQRIQRRVDELGVTCSIGIGSTKSIAKIASDMDKPHGITVVYPGGEQAFLAPLSVRSLSGIGAATEKKLKRSGIETLGDLAAADDVLIERMLGKLGMIMLSRARGGDDEPVVPDDTVKSVSNEVSFAENLTKRCDIMAAIGTVAAKVGRRLRRKGLAGRTMTLKVRYANFKVRTVQRPLRAPSADEADFMSAAASMLDEVWHEGVALRLVGIAITGFAETSADFEQLSLFGDARVDAGEDRPVSEGADERLRRLAEATDRVRDRFGEKSVAFGREIRTMMNTTGSSSKNPADYK